MSIFSWFRRKPTYRVRVVQTKGVRHSWLWEIVDADGHVKRGYQVLKQQPDGSYA